VIEFKMCGLMSQADAILAAEAGARYLGVIFAGGVREISADQAARVLELRPDGVRGVGVFRATEETARIASVVSIASLDVVQLHGGSAPHMVNSLRGMFRGEIWATARVANGELLDDVGALSEVADVVLIDTQGVDGMGGTGRTFNWAEAARSISRSLSRGRARLAVAGGLSSENVGEAIRALSPDIVDVCSGIERAPGVKDARRVREFADAVRNAVTVSG